MSKLRVIMRRVWALEGRKLSKRQARCLLMAGRGGSY
jgi:hypothetical protein